MKRILLILTFLSLCGQMNAQATESCMAVVKELTMQKNVWSDQKAIDYIINHADSFDKNNEFDMWLYNLGLGTRYYPLKKYNEAIVCLRNVTIFLDEY